MSKPPKLVVPGLNRGAGIPAGYVVGRLPGTGQGPAQLLDLLGLRQLGVATNSAVNQDVSTLNSKITSLSGSLSGSISTINSEITSISTVISGSISTVISEISSLSTAIGGGTGTQGLRGPPGQDGEDGQDFYYMIGGSGTDDDTALSASLSAAVSSITSLSSAVSSVDAGQSTSISTNLSKINSLSTAISAGNAIYAPLCTGDIPGPILMANADGACIMVGISP